MIRLSLLSSPLYPDPNTDKGVHEFAWNVVADASMPAVLDEANRLNAAVLPAMPIRWRRSTRWMASWCLTGSSLPMTVPVI